jgi:type II secretory pathway pseudopilin PulG
MTARHIRTAGKRALPMKAMRTRTVEKSGERGYALLVVLFLVTLLVISAAAVAPNILTAGRREKEKEMIWRGKQYTRGVKLYYRKLGRFPTSLDDLTKPKLGSLRFMRQQYKDPMNKEDGAWRFIYVGPAGQLIGSLKPPQQNLTLPQIGAAIGTPASALNGPNTPPPERLYRPIRALLVRMGRRFHRVIRRQSSVAISLAWEARSTSRPSSFTRKQRIIASSNSSGILPRIELVRGSQAYKLERYWASRRVSPSASSPDKIPETRRKIRR